MEKTNVIRERCDIPVSDTWALEDLFSSDEAWEKELAQLSEDQSVLVSYAGRLGENGEVLFDYLTHMEKLNEKLELLGNYAMRKADEDTRDGRYQAMTGQFMGAVSAISSECSFETPELVAIPEEKLAGFYRDYPQL